MNVPFLLKVTKLPNFNLYNLVFFLLLLLVPNVILLMIFSIKS